MEFEYKCVGAPERPRRQRGVTGRSDRVALAMQEIIGAEAIDGWEYLRAETVPVEEKAGFFSRTHAVQRAVLIFRRELEPEPRVIPARRPGVATGPESSAQPSPNPGGVANQRAEQRAESGNEARIRLSADRDKPAPPARGNRLPPSGIG